MKDTPVFVRTKLKTQVQVKLYISTEVELAFREAITANGMRMADTMEQLMVWFTKSHKAGTLKVEDKQC